MRYLILVVLSVITLNSFGQQMTYEQWKEDAKTEIRLLPEYGNGKKTDGQIASDNELIKTSLKADTTPRKASDHFVQLGFTYLFNGDMRTAMYRFNQAWLLDSKNENAYWGFGAIYATFNDYPTAITQYDKGFNYQSE